MSEVSSRTIEAHVSCTHGSLVDRILLSPVGGSGETEAIEPYFYDFEGKNVRITIEEIP